jgi:hypothetical protein
MIYKYLDYINESRSNDTKAVYWTSSLELDKNWSEITVKRHSGDYYLITYNYKDGDTYSYNNVLFEKNNIQDIYYVENPEKFIEKFRNEFFKNVKEYKEDLKYIPKCLGLNKDQLDQLEKYNF